MNSFCWLGARCDTLHSRFLRLSAFSNLISQLPLSIRKSSQRFSQSSDVTAFWLSDTIQTLDKRCAFAGYHRSQWRRWHCVNRLRPSTACTLLKEHRNNKLFCAGCHPVRIRRRHSVLKVIFPSGTHSVWRVLWRILKPIIVRIEKRFLRIDFPFGQGCWVCARVHRPARGNKSKPFNSAAT